MLQGVSAIHVVCKRRLEDSGVLVQMLVGCGANINAKSDLVSHLGACNHCYDTYT